MLPPLASKILAALAGAALSACVGAALVSWLYWDPRYQLQVEKAGAATSMLAVQEAAAKTCKSGIEAQNAGLATLTDTLNKSLQAAEVARLAAVAERKTYEQRAATILAERTPVGVDACAAASAAFDAELRRERGK